MQAKPFPTLILLAAGSGTRFRASGGCTHKLDALLCDVPVLERTLQAVQQSGLPWHLVRQGEGGAGMGDSIAAGVRATGTAHGWLIIPADLPMVRPATLMRVAQALIEVPAEVDVIAPFFNGQQGHPVAFAAHCHAALTALNGDRGASAIVREARAQGRLRELVVDDEGIITDIDTMDDLARAQALLLRARQAGY